jgi:hypothetical protein
MKHRFYLLIMALLVISTFNLSEAGSMYSSAEPTVGPMLGSRTIAVKNDQSMLQRMAQANSAKQGVSAPGPQGRMSANEASASGGLKTGRQELPTKDPSQKKNPGTTQPGGKRAIFDRWGN